MLACCAVAVPAHAASSDVLKRPRPTWYTSALAKKVLKSGPGGVQVPADSLNVDCPGYQQRGVSAAGCIVAPYGCTANFVFTDVSSYYIGTARHCVDRVGQPLVMQVDTTTITAVGTVAKMTSGPGEPGNDFSLIRLDQAVVSKWGMNPAIPVIGGPNGVYTGCSPQVVDYFGHGYGVLVSEGKPEVGLATNWLETGYGWTGAGAPGDSGSPVVLADGRAAGNLTHLLVDTDYPGSDQAGMRITAILGFAGVKLVNADGSTTSAGPPTCTARTGGALRGLRL
jgi:hypothetical protein